MGKIGRRLRKRSILLPMVLLGVLAIVLGSLFYLNSKKTFEGRTTTLFIGTPAIEENTLIYIAGEMGYFKRNGLNVTIKQYDSGGAAVPGLIRNEVDLAIASEFVMVTHLLQQRKIQSLGSIDRFENMFVTARRDRNIGKITDLKNRIIGLPQGTIAEFYLSRYFILHGLGPFDVTLRNVRPDDSANVLASGDVDAVVTWHPYVDRIVDQQGDRVIVWPIQSSQLTYWNIIARADWVGANHEPINRLLRSILQAEEYVTLHSEKTKAVVKRQLGYNDAYIAKVWGDNLFSLSLEQSLIVAMEDEARWMIQNNLVNEKRIPDFVNDIFTDGLKRIRPQAVNIIR